MRLFDNEELEEGAFYDLAGDTKFGNTTEELDQAFLGFLDLLNAARVESRRASEISAHTDVFDISLHAERVKRRRLSEKLEEKFRGAEREHARAVPPPKPLRRQGEAVQRPAAEFDGDEKGRQHAEEKRRGVVVDQLVEVLHQQLGGDRAKLRLAAAGRRASTLEKQVKAWKRCICLLRARYGRDR